MCGFRVPTSLCIRIARDFPGSAEQLREIKRSVLIIGCPGSGKTTLLRDLIRQFSEYDHGSIAVVDEKEELFPRSNSGFCFPVGKRTDILSGCRKQHGIECILRNMGPKTIAVDEITLTSDCEALMHAAWCGVDLLATAHAGSISDLRARPTYKTLVSSGVFKTVVLIHKDKTLTIERM